jgi:hypothetical protein
LKLSRNRINNNINASDSNNPASENEIKNA